MPAAEPACLLIADISGYTKYLAGVELDHAHDILADLVGTIVKSLQPQFRLAGLEGDAVFVYSPTSEVDGSVLLDVIESTYFSFQRRLDSINRASACECNACRLMPALDLKIVAHHGTILRHEVAGRQELLGSDVIVIHRLLKNQVKETLGMSAYALITDSCIEATSLRPQLLDMERYCESYDLGEVCGWAHDLQRAWQRHHDQQRVQVDQEGAMYTRTVEIPAPPALVFELITSPRHRPAWAADPMTIEEHAGTSRRGVGTVNHCVHGDGMVLEEVLDWRPPEYWTVQFEVPGAMVGMMTDSVEPFGEGSKVTMRMRVVEPVDPRARREMLAVVIPLIDAAADGLESYVVAHPVKVETVELPATDEALRLATAVLG
ncbi:MAG: DUF2652 domain-containing protein [Acidimicrobiia bacterium]